MQEISIYDSNDNLINNLVQWDKDVSVYIKEDDIDKNYPVHFFNLDSDASYVVHSTFSNNTLVAKIPNTLLTTAITIVGYVYKESEFEQKSIYRFKIPMRAKPMPSNYAAEGTKDYINIEEVLAECKEETNKSKSWAKNSESWAIGGTETRNGEDTDNSLYYSQQSKSQADIAKLKASEAAASESAAKTSETNAKTSETNSKASETAAKSSETNAASSETTAADYATSAANSANTASTKATDALNSASVASTKAIEAANSASAAKISETNAETSETNAKNSETSSKTSETNAASSASTASTKATEATNSATESKSYATGGTGTRTNENIDNAKYYYEQSKSLAESFSGALRPMGTVDFANLPALSDASEGDMYNISNQFTTTANFKEGAGNVIPAGANVYKTADGEWDVLAGTPVTGVKGNAESSYRKGNVNITPEDIGALTNISIGTVTTGEAGSNASASASTSGTVTTLNLTIPKGDKGDTGATGDTGAKGDKGDTGLMYGTCSTAAATATKTVALTGFVLATGAAIIVKFTVTNTAANPTLNVNNTGAKEIRYKNSAITAGYLVANKTYLFAYDGSYWQLVGDVDTNTIYSAATANPKANGTAAVGSSEKYAREDHVHPLQTSVAKLTTARTINDVEFDGTKNISISQISAKSVSGEVDLNDLRTTTGIGIWNIDSANQTVLNKPTTGEARGTLIDINYSAAYWGTQYFFHYNTNRAYTRNYNLGSGSKVAFGAWRQLTNDNGSSLSAAKLSTARNISIGGVSKSFDGSSNVSFALNELPFINKILQFNVNTAASAAQKADYGNYYTKISLSSLNQPKSIFFAISNVAAAAIPTSDVEQIARTTVWSVSALKAKPTLSDASHLLPMLLVFYEESSDSIVLSSPQNHYQGTLMGIGG